MTGATGVKEPWEIGLGCVIRRDQNSQIGFTHDILRYTWLKTKVKRAKGKKARRHWGKIEAYRKWNLYLLLHVWMDPFKNKSACAFTVCVQYYVMSSRLFYLYVVIMGDQQKMVTANLHSFKLTSFTWEVLAGVTWVTWVCWHRVWAYLFLKVTRLNPGKVSISNPAFLSRSLRFFVIFLYLRPVCICAFADISVIMQSVPTSAISLCLEVYAF